MSRQFEPQKTNMDSFSEIEMKLFNMAINQGFSDETSMAIAHSFTQFNLGYITPEGFAQNLVKSGVNKSDAVQLVDLFVDIREQAELSPNEASGADA